MKKHRRIEITALRRSVTVVSHYRYSNNADEQSDADVRRSGADSVETIEMESEEGQRILSEAVRLLEGKLGNQRRKELK